MLFWAFTHHIESRYHPTKITRGQTICWGQRSNEVKFKKCYIEHLHIIWGQGHHPNKVKWGQEMFWGQRSNEVNFKKCYFEHLHIIL